MDAILSSRGAKIGDPGSRHPPAQPCLAILSSLLYPPCPEKESRPAQEVNMSSLYLRGKTWWAKSLENGRVVRWSLKTASRAEAKRRIKLYDSRPREEPLPSRLKGQIKGQTTWDVAASELLDYYQASARGAPTRRGGCCAHWAGSLVGGTSRISMPQWSCGTWQSGGDKGKHQLRSISSWQRYDAPCA